MALVPPESELREFFDMLFTLPQLLNLQLKLRHSFLKPHHCSLMHDSWTTNARQSGKRLKVLKFKGYGIANNFQDHMSELQVMA